MRSNTEMQSEIRKATVNATPDDTLAASIIMAGLLASGNYTQGSRQSFEDQSRLVWLTDGFDDRLSPLVVDDGMVILKALKARKRRVRGT